MLQYWTLIRGHMRNIERERAKELIFGLSSDMENKIIFVLGQCTSFLLTFLLFSCKIPYDLGD